MWIPVIKEFGKYSIKFQYLEKLFQSGTKYSVRAISNDKLRKLNDDTLTGRFLIYLDSNLTYNKNFKEKKNVITSLNPLSRNVQFVNNVEELTELLYELNNKDFIKTYHQFNKYFHIIDSQCCRKLNEFNFDDSLQLLSAFTNIIGHKLDNCMYFQLALDHLLENKEKLNKNQLIHLIFFVGMLKKCKKSQQMHKECIRLLKNSDIQNLTKEDLCIICNSTFKTSTKIKNIQFLNKIQQYINDNLQLLNDPAIFITLIKTLRHNHHIDDNLISNISCTIFFNKTIQYYSFAALCHILALYADYLYYDEEILKIFTTKCLEELKNSKYQSKRAYLLDQPRSKDIKRFLWSLSTLNFKLAKDDIEKILLPQIIVRIQSGEFENDPGSLVQIFLYLWMMQYKVLDLIRAFLTPKVAQYIREYDVASQESLNLLLICLYYEQHELYEELKIPLQTVSKYNLNNQLNKRPILTKIVESLKNNTINNINKYEICCQVPFINIIGIVGLQKKIYKTVHIEILDECTCLKNTENLPTGLMELKLRLLEKSEQGLVVIEKLDLESCSDKEFYEILKDEITLVC